MAPRWRQTGTDSLPTAPLSEAQRELGHRAMWSDSWMPTRPLALRHPLHGSMILRRQEVPRSKSTGREAKSSLVLEGIAGVIPSRKRWSSIRLARVPVPPTCAVGQGTGVPSWSQSDSPACSSRSTAAVPLCAWPAVQRKVNGCSFASLSKCSFVEQPPRERPHA